MEHWVRGAARAGIMISIAVPSHATQYLTLEQAQQLAFPDASRFVEAHVMFQPSDVAAIERRSGEKVRTRGQQVWRALAGDRPVRFFIVDYVIGKHLLIDYVVALEPDGRVRRVEILEYPESYRREITHHTSLEQFLCHSSRRSL